MIMMFSTESPVPPPGQFKMQFKVITTILLFFVAQTMATPSFQTSDDALKLARISCTLAFMVLSLLCKGPKLIMISCIYLRQ